MAIATAMALPAFAQDINVGLNANAQVGGASGLSGLAPGHMQGGGKINNRGNGPGSNGGGPGMMGTMRPGVSGTVTAVSGSIITITGHQGFGSTTTATTFTVDATNATVRKANATSTISSIAIGDRIFAMGTVTGTNVVATNIIDGVGMMGGRGMGGKPGMMASSTPPFMGNGQPVIAGKISAISGNSLTVTTASNVTYTIDASNAKVVQGRNTIALSAVSVGQNVLVQGAINGTSVTASTVIDQGVPAVAGQAPGQGQGGDNGNGQGGGNQGAHVGVFAGIGNFFKHLFGF